MTLKDERLRNNLTQQQAAELMGISLRSYKAYENELAKRDSFKYTYMLDKLKALNPLDEEHGVLPVEDIKARCAEIFDKYQINYCYLFGSYAKGTAQETSDIDLLIASEVSGLKFFSLIEELRVALSKRVDALDINQLKDNFVLTQEILESGIKIYG